MGTNAVAVRVEVHLAPGLPGFTLVGLPDTEVRESRERVRSAMLNSGFEFPSRRITVNLAPADLPKGSGRFDLAIALGIAAASGQLPKATLDSWEFAGELSLSGELLPCTGALAMAVAMYKDKLTQQGARHQFMLPVRNANEAACVSAVCPDIQIVGAPNLLQAAAHLVGHGPGLTQTTPQLPVDRLLATNADFRDVRGQTAAKRALEIAAAGHHNVLMLGSPGSGKSMLASRLNSILPAMPVEQALESMAIQSLKGETPLPLGSRPFRSPHHSSSMAALIGGGQPPKPGEITLAHHGTLFLDEVLEFDRRSLEALREPLETGCVHISRAGYSLQFPAEFLWMVAHNPCPCGWLGHPVQSCRCTPDQIAKYSSKLSGPLLDRIDIGLEVNTVEHEQIMKPADGERSADIAQRTQAAHLLQMARQGCPNGMLRGDALMLHCKADSTAEQLLLAVSKKLGWSGRSMHRVLRVARTIADLAHRDAIEQRHVAEAIQYRKTLLQGRQGGTSASGW